MNNTQDFRKCTLKGQIVREDQDLGGGFREEMRVTLSSGGETGQVTGVR